MRRTALLIVLAVVAVSLGCTGQRGTFAVVSTSWRPDVAAPVLVEGKHCRRQKALLRATEDALAQLPGANALANVRFWYDGRCYFVQGYAFTVED